MTGTTTTAVSLPPLYHVGIVVTDFDQAVDDFMQRWGSPTVRVRDLHFPDARFHGSPIDLRARYGFIATGASELELIQPLSTPSPYAEFLDANGGDGVHHLAYVVDSIDTHIEQLRALGLTATPLLDAAIGELGRFVYVEHAAHGPVVELIEIMGQQIMGQQGETSS
jgi:methylmalonyl-CoA/ethylmalonyl-CoA epimerase